MQSPLESIHSNPGWRVTLRNSSVQSLRGAVRHGATETWRSPCAQIRTATGPAVRPGAPAVHRADELMRCWDERPTWGALSQSWSWHSSHHHKKHQRHQWQAAHHCPAGTAPRRRHAALVFGATLTTLKYGDQHAVRQRLDLSENALVGVYTLCVLVPPTPCPITAAATERSQCRLELWFWRCFAAKPAPDCGRVERTSKRKGPPT